MDKIKMIIGDNFEDINNQVIKNIDISDLSMQNLVIVPDRFSLLCEKKIFEILKIKAYFNISVIGISDLANMVFENAGLEFEYINKQESKLIIRKALKNLQGKLKCFINNINSGLVDVIFNSIVSFKSNEILPEKIKENSLELSEVIKNKLEDLSLIYTEYERLLAGRLDSTNILTQLNSLLQEQDFSKTNLFYVNFDSFTKQGFTVLKNLAKFSNKVVIGAINPPKQKNAFIFEKDVCEKILSLAKEENLEVEVEEIKNSLTNKQLKVFQNVFSLSPEKHEDSFVEIFEANKVKDEIENLAKKIKKLVYDGKSKYKDISVACGGLDAYKNEIENIFSEYNFSYFLDTEITLAETEPIKFILSALKTLQESGNIEDFENVFLSSYSPLNKNEKNLLVEFIEKYDIKLGGVEEDFKSENINLIKNKITEKIKILKNIKNNSKNIKNYLIIIKNIIILFNLHNINDEKIINFQKHNLIKQEKIYLQIFDSLEKVETSLGKILQEENLEFDEFIEIFEMAVQGQNLSTVPLSLDSIFVGDATSSFFEKSKYLFLLGANENLLPQYLSDTAILNDEVIEKISEQIVLTPTVKMINRRNRFKVFSLLLQAQEKLFISFHSTDEDGKKLLPSVFIKDLIKTFGEQILTRSNQNFLLGREYDDEKQLAKEFAFEVGVKNKAKKEYLKTLQNHNFEFANLTASLSKYLSIDFAKISKLQELKIDNLEQLFFDKNRTKISQIEKFYECPFKQFATYGLKLKEKDLAVVNVADIGQFIHKVAQEFLEPKNNNINKIKNNIEKINLIVEKIIKKLEKINIFNKFLLKINKISFNIIKEESLRLCEYLFITSQKSKFQPKFLEVFFGGDNTEKLSLKVRDENFEVVGVVDRVDVYENMFVVIDYKSGSSTKGNNSELFYGEKLQIFVYAKAMQEILKSKVQGLYYFPISNAYSDENNTPYFLMGKSSANPKFLRAMDTSLSFENPKSEIFSCEIKTNKDVLKSGAIEYVSKPSIETERTIKNMLDYSMEMIKNAVGEILEGNIFVSPYEDACEYCKYLPICQKSKNQQPRKSIYDTKKSDVFNDVLKETENE